jgi:gliding motility-associated-like protein
MRNKHNACFFLFLLLSVYGRGQVKEGWSFFKGDTLAGFDIQAAYSAALSEKLKGAELLGELKARETEFVNRKYGIHSILNQGIAPPFILTSTCNNLGFETGDFTGWTGSTGYNTNSSAPLTVSSAGINSIVLNSPEPSCSFQTIVNAAAGSDPYSGLSMLDPGGGVYACRLGGEEVNLDSKTFNSCSGGNSPYSGGELIQQTFLVTPGNALFSYNYSVILASAPHTNTQVPYFRAEVLDGSGTPIPCLQYYVESDSLTPPPGFFISNGSPGSSSGGAGAVFYCNWTSNSLNLKPYMGQNVTIRFTAAGCTKGGHFGYAYVDASCSAFQVIASTPSSCQGQAITLTAPGSGTTGTYQWATVPPGGPGISGITTGQSITVNQTGTYQVTVTQAPNCFYVIDTTITFFPNPSVTATSTNATCSPGSDGTATAIVSGVPAGYSIVWSPAPGAGQGTLNPTSMTAGTYNLTITTQSGCTASTSVSIVQPNGIVLAVANTNVSCFGLSDGSATTTAAGGTGTLSFSWGGSPTAIASQTGSAIGLAAGTYSCIVKDTKGCATQANFTITQPPLLMVSAVGLQATCNKDCNGQLICVPAGGTSSYTYSWNTNCTNPSCVNVCAGLYTVTVKDAHGCLSTDTALVKQPPPLAASLQPVSAHCNKSDGKDSVTVSGGTAGYSYSWTPGTGSAGPGYTNIPAGTYTVYIHDAHNCLLIDTNKVANLPGVNVAVVSTVQVTCFGGKDGSATVAGSGGFPVYSFDWNPSPAGGQGQITATGLGAGTYICTITDSMKCTGTTTVTITQPPLLTLSASPPVSVCIGTCTDLSASANGGSPTYGYSWTQNGAPTGTHVCPLQTTTYTVACTDSHGCMTAPIPITITVSPPLEVLSTGNATICPGASDTLHASASGGNGHYTYTWFPSAGLSNAALQNPVASPATATTYTVIVSDNCGTPTDSALAIINLFPPPVLNFVSTDTVGCAPICIHFTGSSVPDCSTADWTFGDGGKGTGCGAIKHCYSLGGNYTVTYTVTDNQGCKGSVSKIDFINAYPTPEAAFNAAPQPATILSPEITFEDLSQGASSWSWSFGDLTGTTSSIENPQFTYSDTGCFPVILIVANSYNCKDTAKTFICIDSDFTFYAPNTFTPNGDGKNEIWMPYGTGIDLNNYGLMMFDRWGNLMFETTVWGQGWDGRANNGANLAQIDTYVWKVELKDLKGRKHSFSGHCNLIR